MELREKTPDHAERSGEKLKSLPASWFHFCSAGDLLHGPKKVTIFGSRFVGYRTQGGQCVVISGRCPHLGADLGEGTVRGDHLVCPLHGWEYGTDGICKRIPEGSAIPAFARVASFPVEERGGHVFFFNRKEARFPLPFFEGESEATLLAAKPFELHANTPWYFVGANGFDLQHFRMAHDRTLLEEPIVEALSPFARRLVARFSVSGKSVPDRLIRTVAGPVVTMEITSWCGTMVLVKAHFRRTTSFGLFNVLPIDYERTLGRVIVWVRRSGNPLGRALFDPLNASVRRLFIQNFLRSDLPRIAGLRYFPEKMIAADKVMADYFTWLEKSFEPMPSESL